MAERERRPAWTLQRATNEGWVDVVTEYSIPEIRDRHTEYERRKDGYLYRVARSDEPIPE